MAEKALRKLFTYVEYLNPDVLDYLFGVGLITRNEKARIETEASRTEKAKLILENLLLRDEKKAIWGLIDALKKDEEVNEKFLLKIAEGKRLCYYHYYKISLLVITITLRREAQTLLPSIVLFPHIVYPDYKHKQTEQVPFSA